MFDEIEPFQSGFLNVDSVHSVYFEVSGNPMGTPVLFLHGGPGGSTKPDDRRYFNPLHYKIILHDQRGCGKSTPLANLSQNTWDLVKDCEKIREKLNISKWLVVGGSWGSTLSLTYAIMHPENVLGLVLRGIFTLRKSEIHWLYQDGASRVFPDFFKEYKNAIPVEEQDNLLLAYHKRIVPEVYGLDYSAEESLKFSRAWCKWELSTSRLLVDSELIKKADSDTWATHFARIETHYFVNNGFFEYDGWILNNIDKIRHIPCVIVQGRYDMVCPTDSAWELHSVFPEAELHIIADAGHSAKESGILKKTMEAIEKFERLK